MGERLFGEVAKATGLPKELIEEELAGLIQAAGINPAQMTMDDLRQILAEYVQDVLVAAKAKCDPSKSDDESR